MELAPSRRLARTKGNLDDAVAIADDRRHEVGGVGGCDADRLHRRGPSAGRVLRRSPDQLSEEEVRRYLLGLRERGVALGTFRAYQGGIQFLYRRTLDRDWALFQEIRPPKQLRLPEVLSDEQVRALLGGVRIPVHKACLASCTPAACA